MDYKQDPVSNPLFTGIPINITWISNKMDYCNQIMAGAAARIEIMHGYI